MGERNFDSITSVSDAKIATLGSHSALQILKGARDEGFETVVIAAGKHAQLYKRFDLAGEIIEVGDYSEVAEAAVEDKLVAENAVFVPHGSVVSHMNLEQNKKFKAMYYGNKRVLEWEFDRAKQRNWLEKAGLNVPRQFREPGDIDRQTIVKYYGAQGGKGYFIARNEGEYEAGLDKFGRKPAVIQEYIIGVPLFVHYFQSSLTGELEIMSIDRRYETNVDSLGRLPLKSQQGVEIDPSFVVVGNSPLVLRESLLEDAYQMGENLVAASRQLVGGRGLYGPFCIETIITPEQEFYVIEVSARIVAGTNLFVEGSPYTALRYGEPMSTGRRIAREIKNAILGGRLEEVVT